MRYTTETYIVWKDEIELKDFFRELEELSKTENYKILGDYCVGWGRGRGGGDGKVEDKRLTRTVPFFDKEQSSDTWAKEFDWGAIYFDFEFCGVGKSTVSIPNYEDQYPLSHTGFVYIGINYGVQYYGESEYEEEDYDEQSLLWYSAFKLLFSRCSATYLISLSNAKDSGFPTEVGIEVGTILFSRDDDNPSKLCQKFEQRLVESDMTSSLGELW